MPPALPASVHISKLWDPLPDHQKIHVKIASILSLLFSHVFNECHLHFKHGVTYYVRHTIFTTNF